MQTANARLAFLHGSHEGCCCCREQNNQSFETDGQRREKTVMGSRFWECYVASTPVLRSCFCAAASQRRKSTMWKINTLEGSKEKKHWSVLWGCLKAAGKFWEVQGDDSRGRYSLRGQLRAAHTSSDWEMQEGRKGRGKTRLGSGPDTPIDDAGRGKEAFTLAVNRSFHQQTVYRLWNCSQITYSCCSFTLLCMHLSLW